MGSPRISITRKVRFAAARRLRSPVLDAASEERLYGAERGLHGHDFTLEVTLRGEVPPETGMVMDLKALSRLIKQEVVARLDRTRLDGGALLGAEPATTENLAAAIWRALATRLPSGLLHEVALAEGSGLRVRYRGE